MNDAINAYIRNQVLLRPSKLNEDLFHNNMKFIPRSDYNDVIKYIDDFLQGNDLNRYLVLSGIRDVGKTTILFQIYEYLLKEKNISPQNILYVSCDRLKKIGNEDILNCVSSYLDMYHNAIIETVDKPIFLLIDEAQYDPQWSLSGKLIYDASKNIFMIFSGSSALKLSYNADSARRLLNIPIYPLNYYEHLKLKYGYFENNVSDSIINMIFDGNIEDSGKIESNILNIYANFPRYNVFEWKNFLQFGGFPSAFHQNNKDITKKIVDMVNKVVTMDLTNIRGMNDDSKTLAFNLLYFFAFQNPGEISKGSLSNQFDVSMSQITKILDVLEKTQLIFHIEAFTSSSKRTTKPHEYFFATSSLKHNLSSDLGNANLENETAYMGKLLENSVASSFLNLDNRSAVNYKTYYDDSKKKKKEKHVDFIVQRGNEKPIPIEVSCGEKDKTQIGRAISKYGSPHGVVISKTTDHIVKKGNIICLPPEIFAFM